MIMRNLRSRAARIAGLAALASTVLAGGPLGLASTAAIASLSSDPLLLPPPSYAEASMSPDWVATPAGLAYKSCVHEVPNDAVVSLSDGTVVSAGVTSKIPSCPYSGIVAYPDTASDGSIVQVPTDKNSSTPPPPLPSGWWVGSWWNSPSQITRLSATWAVPNNPTSNGALIYLFPSIEPTSGTSIVQPVLQWGTGAAGGGNAWNVASWYVTGGSSVHTALLATAAGHILSGYMSRGSSTSGTWTINVTDTTTGQYRTLGTNTGITSWKTAQGGILEVYSISACNQLPNSTSAHFYYISVTTTAGGLPTFAPTYWQSGVCSDGALAGSNYTYVTWVP